VVDKWWVIHKEFSLNAAKKLKIFLTISSLLATPFGIGGG